MIKTRYIKYFNNEEIPYGGTVVAIMCYGGYNMEDSLLINEGSIKRGCLQRLIIIRMKHMKKSESGDNKSESLFGNVDEKIEVLVERGL